MTTPAVQSAMQSLTLDVEREIVTQIIQNMKERKMTLDEAHNLAHDFLSLLPIEDKHDLLKKLGELGGKYDEVLPVYLKEARPVEEAERVMKLQAMSLAIKNGEIEKAIAVAKGGTQ